jgi:hemolysin III
MFNKLGDPVSGLTHLAAAIAAVIGSAGMLYVGRDSAAKVISLLIYGVSLVLMFAASAAYHLLKFKPHLTPLLRKIDHSAIYFLIAGTYTPVCLHFLNGLLMWGLLALVWVIAVAGIVVKIFVIHAPRWLRAGIYLLMGWLALMAIREIFATMPTTALVWLFLGGFFFTVGAVVYATRKPDFFPDVFGFHEIFHIFVILGCASHFIVIAAYVAPKTA